MLSTRSKVALAPNGNGGVYAGTTTAFMTPLWALASTSCKSRSALSDPAMTVFDEPWLSPLRTHILGSSCVRIAVFVAALRRSGALADMKRRGVVHVHVYGVDNVRAARSCSCCHSSWCCIHLG